jgi:hypothetical protein
VRAYLHQNQISSTDFGPEILGNSGRRNRILIAAALIACLFAYGYYKFVYEQEEAEEELYFLLDDRQGFQS